MQWHCRKPSSFRVLNQNVVLVNNSRTAWLAFKIIMLFLSSLDNFFIRNAFITFQKEVDNFEK